MKSLLLSARRGHDLCKFYSVAFSFSSEVSLRFLLNASECSLRRRRDLCENKDLFQRRILGILLCQANLQHQRQPDSPRSEYFSNDFDKLSKILQIFENQPTFNLFPEIFSIYIPLFRSSETKSTVQTASLLLLASGLEYLAFNAARL